MLTGEAGLLEVLAGEVVLESYLLGQIDFVSSPKARGLTYGDLRFNAVSTNQCLRFEKRLPITNRNGEIRSAELTHHGKVNSYNFAFIIEEGTARAARTGLGIIDNLVRQHITDMPLGNDRPDQVAPGKFFHQLLRITFGRGRDGLNRLCACPSQDCTNGSRISKQYDGSAADGRTAAISQSDLLDSQF